MSEPSGFPSPFPCPEEVQRLMAEHPVLRVYILTLQQQIVSLQAQVEALQEEVKQLRDRLDLDSHNSHTPPSSDKGRSTQSLRAPSERSPGAQEGHTGAH